MDAETRSREKYPDAPRWKVIVKAEGHDPVEVTVSALDEWKARTNAMLDDSIPPLRGEFVDYEIAQIEA